jgi:hypothetical protein
MSEKLQGETVSGNSRLFLFQVAESCRTSEGCRAGPRSGPAFGLTTGHLHKPKQTVRATGES